MTKPSQPRGHLVDPNTIRTPEGMQLHEEQQRLLQLLTAQQERIDRLETELRALQADYARLWPRRLQAWLLSLFRRSHA